MRKKLFQFQNFQKIVFSLAFRKSLAFNDGAHWEANFAELRTFLIEILVGQPLILSLVKQLQHRKQKALFSRQNSSSS